MKKTIITLLSCTFLTLSCNDLVYAGQQSTINVKAPLVPERQYFSYKNHNSRSVTLERLQQFNCHKIFEVYDKNPLQILDDIGLVILVQKALEGVDIQTMSPEQRDGLVTSEVMKKLRQMGRIKELTEFQGVNKVVPSVAALCHILEDEKMDILRQKNHVPYKPEWGIAKP